MTEETACMECGMLVKATEYHPYAACLMFKAGHNEGMVRANIMGVLMYASAPLKEQLIQATNKIERYQAIVEAAIGFKKGCDITAERTAMLVEGHEFAIDELDELDLEEILGKLQLIKAVEALQGEKPYKMNKGEENVLYSALKKSVTIQGEKFEAVDEETFQRNIDDFIDTR